MGQDAAAPPDADDARTLVFDKTQLLATPAPGAEGAAAHPAGKTDTVDSSLLRVGTRAGEFEITRLIGQGGFGVVYEAWDHTLERTVAIKEYMPSSLASRQGDGSVVPLSERHKETFDTGMRSFINEARLLAQFDHPSLLKVYRFWQERGTTYMVMPCYRGETLKQALARKKGAVDEAWLLGVADGVTQALAVMHGANCYHRDIAPDNIMLLEGSGLPVVLDFGAARRVITDMTQAITVILKPGYAPIEQYAEVPDMTQGAWTDVYALSAVMHVAIVGRSPPPSVARLMNDAYQPLAGNMALRERFSEQVLAAVDAGLAVRPQARPQSMAAFRQALGLQQDAQTVALPALQKPAGAKVALPVSAPASVPQPAPAPQPVPVEPGATRRSGARRAAFGLVAVLALAAGAWWLWANSSGPAEHGQTAATVPPPVPAAVVSAAAPPPLPALTVPAAVAPVFSASGSLQRLGAGAAAGFEVAARAGKPEVRIGKDRLEFQVQSNRDGFLYVYLLSSGGDLFLLFPNALDKRNRINAGTPVSLPRPAWAMDAGGPAGVNEFVALVSQHERDFRAAGMQQDGVFGQFSPAILAALEAANATGPSPLRGTPVCPGQAPCEDVYGVGSFKITEK